LLLIFPIGIAVFGTFRGPGLPERVPKTGTFNELYVDMCGDDTISRSECAKAIKENTPDTLEFLGMKLNHSTAEALDDGVVEAIPYLIVLALVILTGWYQVRQTQARQQKQGTPINPQMQTITRIMPVFFGFISYTLNSATTIYFAVSNLWRIGQQHLVLNKMYEEAAAEAAAAKKTTTTVEPEAPPAAKPSVSKTEGARAKSSGASGAGAAPKRPPAKNTSNRKKKRRRR
jgi:membrane protein insertase Oxa1/YidC/SpoIIIJ